MSKGKPWSVEEEKQLREMVQEHKRLNEIAEFFGKSPASIKMKINRLKLVVVVRQIQHTTTSTELSSVEEALKDLVEAKTPLSVIAKKLGVSEESARAKIRRLGFVFWEVGWLGNWSFVVVCFHFSCVRVSCLECSFVLCRCQKISG